MALLIFSYLNVGQVGGDKSSWLTGIFRRMLFIGDGPLGHREELSESCLRKGSLRYLGGIQSFTVEKYCPRGFSVALWVPSCEDIVRTPDKAWATRSVTRRERLECALQEPRAPAAQWPLGSRVF